MNGNVKFLCKKKMVFYIKTQIFIQPTMDCSSGKATESLNKNETKWWLKKGIQTPFMFEIEVFTDRNGGCFIYYCRFCWISIWFCFDSLENCWLYCTS